MQSIAGLCRRVWNSIKGQTPSGAAHNPAAAAGTGPTDHEPLKPLIYVEPVIRMLFISNEAHTELPEGTLDPEATMHGLEPNIGFKGSLGANYYNSILVLPSWLKRECLAGGFEWGRHCILTDRIVPDVTYQKLLAFLDEYCSGCAGPLDEAERKLAQLGSWEFEDIDSRMPGRPRWHITARLLDLWSPDVDLATFTPTGDYGIRVRLRVGAEGGIEAGDDSAVFEFLLCTPYWLAQHRDLSQLLLCDNIAFMQGFDLEVLRRNAASVCSESKGYTAEEAIRKMDRYAERIAP